ncbi:MAG: hypothetical protein L6R41_004468 [Letrouitia leprolyta]|nr:MAG: hypothetical protein L6R41_004468 [Letrouitia leprolyta]
MTFHLKTPSSSAPITATCLNVGDNDCCKPHSSVILPNPGTSSLTDYTSTIIAFTGLWGNRAGCGWPPVTHGDFENTECAGVPIAVTDSRYETRVKKIRTPKVRQAPTLQNMAFAASWAHLGGPDVYRPVLERPGKKAVPDVYGVNGTDYWVGEDGVYRSSGGEILGV